MHSYVVTGASRGIGFEFIRQLSLNPENQVFALVRNTEAVAKKVALLPNPENVHIIAGDIKNVTQLKAAAQDVAKHTGGKLDYLINNAAYVEPNNAHLPLTEFDGREDVLEKDLRDSFDVNVIGTIHAINAFLPLLRAGTAKKVITISTGVADPVLLEKTGFYISSPYCISKAGTNMVVTKYALQFREEGFTFVALSPGLVNTLERDPTPDEMAIGNAVVTMLRKVKPTFDGPITPEESVKAQLEVIYRLSVKDTGSFISHHGDRNWV